MQIDDKVLYELLQWAVGNRGPKTGNPYCVPEVKAVLRAIAVHRGFKHPEHSYFDAMDKWVNENSITITGTVDDVTVSGGR